MFFPLLYWYFRATFFEPGSSWKRVVAAKGIGEMRQITLEWDFRHTVWNPLSWRLFGDPMIFLDEVKIHVLENGEM
jgi:hypothetical protein